VAPTDAVHVYVGVGVYVVPLGRDVTGPGGGWTVKGTALLQVPPDAFFACTDQE
jgi:hypothetical protein